MENSATTSTAPQISPTQTKACNTESQRLIGLDLVRGVSALLVCFDHLAHFYVDETNTKLPWVLTKVFEVLKHSGGIAVMVFFVLSGYLVGGSVIGKCARGSFSFKGYFVDRLTRLWIVLIPALLLTLCWDLVGNAAGGAQGYQGAYRDIYGSGPSSESPATHSLACFAGNLVFLQKVLTPIYGSNGPLWSLAYEWWYYVIFPLLLVGATLMISGKKKGAFLVAAALIVMALLPKFMIAFFMVWCAGVAAYLLREKLRWFRNQNVTKGLAGVSTLVAASIFVLAEGSMGNLEKLAFGVASAGLIPWCATLKIRFPAPRAAIVFVSEVSYSLYLYHYPVILFFAFVIGRGKRVALDFGSFSMVLAMCVALFIYSAILWFLFERNTHFVKSRVRQLLGY